MKTKRILGYSRDDWGGIKNHHINEVCNTLCVARRVNTMIYVIEWDEQWEDGNQLRHADEDILRTAATTGD